MNLNKLKKLLLRKEQESKLKLQQKEDLCRKPMKGQELLPKLLQKEPEEKERKGKLELRLNFKLREELMNRLLKEPESKLKLQLKELPKKKL